MFFEKNHTQNMAEKLVSSPFIKNQNWAYLWINILKCYSFLFVVCPSQGPPKRVKNKVLATCFYLRKGFFQKKRGLELVSMLHFLHHFEEKYFSCSIKSNDQNSLTDCLFFLRYWTICVYYLFPSLWRRKF